MKRLSPFLPLLLLAALLLSPAAALRGAKDGLDIWWNHVFHALLPSFICVKLAQELGLLRSVHRHRKGQLSMVIGFALASGAPNGAKLLYGLVQEGSLSAKDGENLLPLISSVSPAFLLSIIASELLKNKALFLPIALSFYGCIFCFLVPYMLRSRDVEQIVTGQKPPSFSAALSSAIESSMMDMLRVGGCILFACTLLSLVRNTMMSDTAYAALAGVLEVSTGTSVISQLPLPLRLKTSLLIGAAAFGGMSLALQTMCCYPGLRLLPYLIRKLLLCALSGLLCYLLFPLFPSVSNVFANRQEVLTRSLSLGSLFLSCALSIAFVGVLSLMMRPRNYGK